MEQPKTNTNNIYESTEQECVDAIKKALEKKEEWARLSYEHKLSLVNGALRRLREKLPEYADACLKKRGAQPEDSLLPAYMLTSMNLGAWLSGIRETLESLASTNNLPTSQNITENPDGTSRVKVGPSEILTDIITGFGSLELYVQGKPTQTNPYQKGEGIAVVLGAGNYDAPVDVLTGLFSENKVVIYKPSPLHRPLLHIFRFIFSEYIQKGYVYILEGGPSVSSLLLNHPNVDKWIMTGAERTAKQLIFGTPTPTDTDEPKLTKPCLLELGNCSPYIVVPGLWSNSEIDLHASHLAMAFGFNGGQVCAHPQVIITSAQWPQRQEFLEAVKKYIGLNPAMTAFYPEVVQNFERIRGLLEKEKGPDIQVVTPRPIAPLLKDETYRAVFATNLPQDSVITKEEFFCACSGEISLDTPDNIAAFLPEAVKFANEKIKGCLNATIIAKVNTPDEQEVLDKALCDLKYGSVGVNAWGLDVFIHPQLVWGGYPGASFKDLQSGIGFLGNIQGYDNVLKAVLRRSFTSTGLYGESVSPRLSSRLTKMMRRLSYAICDRRSDQGYVSWLWGWFTITTATLFNV